jgi:hypothetical protein
MSDKLKSKDIRDEVINDDIFKLLKVFTDTKSQSYDDWYIGRVEDNNDPDKLGRCKIRVFGVFGLDIPTNDLPWATTDANFTGSSIGGLVIPTVGTLVRVRFENNEVYNPIYTTKVGNKGKLTSERNEDYPDSMIMFETEEGEFFKINRKSMESTYRHSTGVQITIGSSGQVTIDTSSVEGEGSFELKAKGDIKLKSDTGSIVLDAPLGNVDLGEGATVSINNLLVDPVTGAPHAIGGQLQGTPGSARVKA